MIWLTSAGINIEDGQRLRRFVDRWPEGLEILPPVTREWKGVGGDGESNQNTGELRRRYKQS